MHLTSESSVSEATIGSSRREQLLEVDDQQNSESNEKFAYLEQPVIQEDAQKDESMIVIALENSWCCSLDESTI